MACCKSRAFCSLGGNHTQASARVPRQIFPVKTSRNSYTAFCNSSHCVQMDPDPAERAVEVDPVDALAAEPPKIVKRKVAMHIGYVGTGYRGECWSHKISHGVNRNDLYSTGLEQ